MNYIRVGGVIIVDFDIVNFEDWIGKKEFEELK